MSLAGWFRVVQLGETPAAGREVLNGLIEMLDVVQPDALVCERSHVISSGHLWHEYDVEFLLAHRDDEDADITLAVGASEALVSWLMAHEHIYTEDGSAERSWATVVVDAVAALLRGEYEVRDHYRGSRLVKTSVHDTFLRNRHISTSGSLLGLLPFFRKVDRVDRRTVDFRCRG